MAKRRRHRGRSRSSASRMRILLTAIVVLIVLFLIYLLIIKMLQHRAQVAGRELSETPVQIDMMDDPEAYLRQERAKAMAESETFFYVFFLMIPSSFILVAIIVIYRLGAKEYGWSPSIGGSDPETEQRMSVARDKIKQHRREQGGRYDLGP